MGQKDEKQPVSLDHRKIDSRGRFRGADVRGYARMRKAMLEREKRLAGPEESPEAVLDKSTKHESDKKSL